MIIPTMKNRRCIIIILSFLIITPLFLVTLSCDKGDGTKATATIRNENQSHNIGISDGASLEIPPGALPRGTAIKMELLPSEEAPLLPDGFDTVLSLYDISADQPLKGEVKVSLPLPEVDDESIVMLFRLSEGKWEEMGFDVVEDFAVVSTDSLSLWAWLDTTVENFRRRSDQFLMTILDADTYVEPIMKRFDELTGLVRYTDIGLELNSPLVSIDERHAAGLISVSAASVDDDSLRVRIRNNHKFYLMAHFDGYGDVSVQRGSYLDIKTLHAVAPHLGKHIIDWLVESLPQNFILLLPEGTAELRAPYHPGEQLVIQFRFDEASAVYSSLDPLLSLVPIADVEMITAMRDIMGAGSRYEENLTNLEESIFENILDVTDIGNALLRAGVLAGEKALRSLLSALVLPAVVEVRKDIIEGRAVDILENGPRAKKGGRLILDYLDIPDARLADLWICDTAGYLGRYSITSRDVDVVGRMNVMMTDIAFDAAGRLYGISFSRFYSIDPLTADTTFIGNHGVPGANALEFGPDGTLYAAGSGRSLYEIDTATGRGSILGNTGYSSSGDLAFNNGNLYLTSARGGSDVLVEIDLNTYQGSEIGEIGFRNVYALDTFADGFLYGISGTDIIRINTGSGQGSFIVSYDGQGLRGANGSSVY